MILRLNFWEGSKGFLPVDGAGGLWVGNGGEGVAVPARGIGALRRVKSSPPLIFRIIVAHLGQVVGSAPGVLATIQSYSHTSHMMAARVVRATLTFAISGQHMRA